MRRGTWLSGIENGKRYCIFEQCKNSYIPLPVVWMQMLLRYCAGNSGRQIPRKKKSEELLYSSLNITNWKSNCTFAAEERDIGSINITVPYIVEQHQVQAPVKVFLVQPDGLHKFGDGKTAG